MCICRMVLWGETIQLSATLCSSFRGAWSLSLWSSASTLLPVAGGVSEQLVQIGKVQRLPQNILGVFHPEAKERLIRSEQLNCRSHERFVRGLSGNPVNAVNGREGRVCEWGVPPESVPVSFRGGVHDTVPVQTGNIHRD